MELMLILIWGWSWVSFRWGPYDLANIRTSIWVQQQNPHGPYVGI